MGNGRHAASEPRQSVAEQPVGSWDGQSAQWYSEYGYAVDVAGPVAADHGQAWADGMSTDGYWDGSGASATYPSPYPDMTSPQQMTAYDPNGYQDPSYAAPPQQPSYPDQATYQAGYEQPVFDQTSYQSGYGQQPYGAASQQEFGGPAPAWEAPVGGVYPQEHGVRADVQPPAGTATVAYPQPSYHSGTSANGLAGLGLTDDGPDEFNFGDFNLTNAGLGGLGLEDVDLGAGASGGQTRDVPGYPAASRYPDAASPVESPAYQPYPSEHQPDQAYLIPHQTMPGQPSQNGYQAYHQAAPEPGPAAYSADGHRQPEYLPPYQQDLGYAQPAFADVPDYTDHPHDAFPLPDYSWPEPGHAQGDPVAHTFAQPDYLTPDYPVTETQFSDTQFSDTQCEDPQYGDTQYHGYGDDQQTTVRPDASPFSEPRYTPGLYQEPAYQEPAGHGVTLATAPAFDHEAPAEFAPTTLSPASAPPVSDHDHQEADQDTDQTDAGQAVANQPGERGGARPAGRTPRARRGRSGVLGVVGPPAAVVGAAAVAVAVVGGLSMSDAKTVSNTASGEAKNTASPLNNQLSALREEASAVAGRASRDQERVSIAQQQAQTLLAAQKRAEALRPKFVLPIQGPYTLTAGFGQASSLWANLHTGQDFAVPTGTSVHAVFDGTVTEAGWLGPYGYAVVITAKDGTQTWYCHLSQIKVRSGPVKAGEVIALSGATGNVTGPHLHLEVRIDGTPINPMPWLRQHGLDP